MKVLVYVEGPSDRDGLGSLLEPIILAGRGKGIGINFLPLGNKDAILRGVARKAALQLQERPDDWIFALPDLHPMRKYNGTVSAHSSCSELARLLNERFAEQASQLHLALNTQRHFRVHCLKHDLESLLLADPAALRRRLGTDHRLEDRWRRPVEEQDDDRPPKRVVEDLFRTYRGKPGYVDTTDAAWILARASLDAIVAACSQQFAPFVSELRTLADGGTLG